MIDPELKQRLSTIPWLSACGGEPDLAIEFVRVDSWQAALAAHGKRSWEDATLEARNELRIYLRNKHPGKSNDWNAVARASREYLAEEVDPSLVPAAEEHSLGKQILALVRWNLQGAILEQHYQKYRPPLFSLKILPVYEQGHFPCGWSEKWPKGKLMVY